MRFEHAQIAQALFQLANARVDEALAFLGVFVLGVFRKIAVSAGYGNLFGADLRSIRERAGRFLPAASVLFWQAGRAWW